MLPILNDTIECSCEDCVSACKRKPGWFAPGEIKPAADLLGLTEQEFFNKYLAVDYYHLGEGFFIFVISPAIVDANPGEEFPFHPNGRCVFLTDDGKCSIHAAKPYECKAFDHRKLDHEGSASHFDVAKSWVDHKDYIVGLLGREPQPNSPNPLQMLQLLFEMAGLK